MRKYLNAYPIQTKIRKQHLEGWSALRQDRTFLAIVSLAFLIFRFVGTVHGQPCYSPPSGLVGWWPGEGDATDLVQGNNGSLQGGVTFSSGEVGQAFNLNGVDGYVRVPASATINVGASNGMTVECWINPSDTSRAQTIVEWNNGSGTIGMHMYHSDPGIGGLGALAANIVSTSGIDHIFASPQNLLVAGSFQHVAVTYDKSSGLATLYYNGTPVVTNNLGVFTPQTSFDLYFGNRVSGSAGVGSFYAGQMDEMGLYGRALTGAEILSIYNAGSLGKCTNGPPSIAIQPTNQTVRLGWTANFYVGVNGLSLHYQWYFNTNPMANATNPSLSLPIAQPSQAGNYTAVITNSYGAVTSDIAVLTVDTTCISASPGIIAWWPAEGDSQDRISANTANFHGGMSFATGEAGQAFSFDGTSGYMDVAASSTLDVGAGSGFTIEGWIKPTDISSGHAIAEWNDAAGNIGVHLWHSDPGISGAGGFFANIVGTNGQGHIISAGGSLLTVNTFQHIALTYDRTTGLAKLYRNGVPVQSQNLGIFRPQTTYPLFFGERPSGASGVGFYRGLMDEIALYNRPLNDSEVLAVFNSGSFGKTCNPPDILAQPQSRRGKPGTNFTFSVTAKGTIPLIYQWRLEGLPIPGATASSWTVTNVQPSKAGNYSVLVTNYLGSVSSSNALLKVDVITAFGNGQPLTNAQANFSTQVTIQLQNVYTNGDIFYTLDGTEPTFFSQFYSGPFIVKNNVILRALGYSADFYEAGELDPIIISIVPTYSLSVTNSGGGTITLNPSGGVYLSNTIVTATAVPASGWSFLQWLGDAPALTTTNAVRMTRNKRIQAVFGTTVNTTAAGPGSVALNPPGGLYPYGTIVSISAIPQPGNFFVLWGNSASGSANPLIFGVTNPNPTISSLFSSVPAGQVSLAVVPVGGGRVTVNPRTNLYNPGATVTVTATADAGQNFLNWSGDASGTQNPLQVTMSQNKTIFANFTHGPVLSVKSPYEGMKPEGFVLTLSGDYGSRYQIDGSTNLTSWNALGTITNTYGAAEFLDSGATNTISRFYRAHLLP